MKKNTQYAIIAAAVLFTVYVIMKLLAPREEKRDKSKKK